jgi:hypothetical protein
MKTLRAILLCAAVCPLLPQVARLSLATRIAHADPAKYHHSPAVHNGPGAHTLAAIATDTAGNTATRERPHDF